MSKKNIYNWFTCPLCLTELPIDELSEDGETCKICYEEDMEVLEATRNGDK